MSAITRGKKRETLVFVPANASIFYGWKSKDFSTLTGVSSADITALGHLSAGFPAGSLLVVGAKSPQPPRVTKRIATAGALQGSVSTFCAYDKLQAAILAGWSVSKGAKGTTLRSATGPRPSVTAIARLSNGALYAFPMNKVDFETFKTILGLESSTTVNTPAERAKVLSGCKKVCPGKASKYLDDGSTFSSFFSTASTDDLGTEGFDILSSERILSV